VRRSTGSAGGVEVLRTLRQFTSTSCNVKFFVGKGLKKSRTVDPGATAAQRGVASASRSSLWHGRRSLPARLAAKCSTTIRTFSRIACGCSSTKDWISGFRKPRGNRPGKLMESQGSGCEVICGSDRKAPTGSGRRWIPDRPRICEQVEEQIANRIPEEQIANRIPSNSEKNRVAT
jgi:hypothetical protein